MSEKEIYMYNELTVSIGTQQLKAFLKGGFFQPKVIAPFLHKHNYTEIHVVTGGTATYTIENNIHKLQSGDMIVIPRNVFHSCEKKDEETMFAAFQINYNMEKTEIFHIGNNISADFLGEIEEAKHTQNYTKLSAYISLFCSYFYTADKISTQSVTDYPFLISEFFSSNYAGDLRLSDLAKMLHLSERQTERLVIEHTGRTFKEELVFIRMNMAKKLLENSNMSLTEIAQYVGYHSYAGFWKAMKKSSIKLND